MGKVIETVADSIAIEILDSGPILVVGKGNELHLYGKTANNVFVTQKLDINLTNKIHGIRKFQNSCDKILLVYGEKEFILIECQDNGKFCEFYRAKLTDWISCGCFLNDNKEFVLLTAHSIILRFSYQVSERKCLLKERIACTDKSTLYCGLLFGNKWLDLIVFGGNAFGELLIWQPAKNEENYDEPLKPKVSTLIHRVTAHNGVIFSIDYEQNSQCLITTSDDRAIKWWKVEFSKQAIWQDTKLQPLSSGYGHVARVFQGRIINEDSNVYALSVGEDSYFCLWNQNGQLIFKRRQQYGAVIWNFVYDYTTKAIYTVGSTGNLVAFGLAQVFNENLKSDFLIQPISYENSTEYITKVKFLNENQLIGITNQNNLKASNFNGHQWQNWQNIEVEVDFKCTVMEVNEDIIAICGYKRLIVLKKQENNEDFVVLQNTEILKGLIRTLIFFNKEKYLICDDQGNCVIFTKCVKERCYFQLPQSKEPWLTTALQLNKQQHIVISNRLGNLLLYRQQLETNNYELKSIIKHPHGNLGATHLVTMEENLTSAIIKSAGHDGVLNIFSVDFLNDTLETCTRQNISVGWVECIEKWSNDRELFLGFNDNHFVVWSKDFDFLLQIPCGGGHRCWSFNITPNTGKISLVFIKNKRIRFLKTSLFNQELNCLPLAKRWHVAPCNAMEILTQTSSSSHISVSAGDDNVIKIHTFNKQNGLKEVKEVHSHISNIRCLKLKPLNRNEFLIFSGGGRAQLCVTKVNSINFHLNEIINYTLRTDTTNHNSKANLYNLNPETRLMSLDVKVLSQDGEYEIFVGCSDGFIRHLKLNINKMEITLLGQYFYGKCIIQIKYIAEKDLVLAAATDGYLTFLDSTISKCLYKLKHHSSGVNGLAIFYNIPNKCVHILSGGDDQTVFYTKLSTDLDFQIIKQFNKPYLHTAQVCACVLSSNGLYGFTSGVDQFVHKLDLNTGNVVGSFSSCVADIKGLSLIDNNVCLLYGCGLQIYAFNS